MKSMFLVLMGVVAASAAMAQAPSSDAAAGGVIASKGKMVLAANGARLGSVYRVNADGSAQLIIDGKMITLPAATLSSANGKLITSLSKSDIADLR